MQTGTDLTIKQEHFLPSKDKTCFLARWLPASNMWKIFPLVPSKRPVTRENWDKLFCQIAKCQMAFFDITVNFIIQKIEK